MGLIYNIYCDESCHLEHDAHQVMVLGAVWCSLDKTREIAERLRAIKLQHQLSSSFELKWVKVSPAKIAFYCDILDYFFDDADLHFRGLIIPDKAKLQHDDLGQDHDAWYYERYFDLLKVLLSPQASYRIYLDIKDTRSADKIQKLHDVLRNSVYDFRREIIERVQTVRSHEIEQMQLADFLTGALSYANRELHSSPAKQELVERMRKRSHYSLSLSTLIQEQKVNIFKMEARSLENVTR